MRLLYGLLTVVSLALLIIAVTTDKKRNKWLYWMLASVFCAELGFFLISCAGSLGAALWANRLCYLGQVFLPPFLTLIILQVCCLKASRRTVTGLLLLGTVVLAITMTPGVLPWYYSSADITVVNGVTHIVREYGPLHTLYYIYLFGYLGADTAILVYAVRGQRMRLPQQSWLLVGAVYIQSAIWLAEQFLPRGFEYLSVSYVLAEVFILLVNSMLQTLDKLHLDEMAVAMGQLETAQSELTTLRAEVEARREAANRPLFDIRELEGRLVELEKEYALTSREGQVLRLLLEGKSREQAAKELYLSGDTVKKHTASLYRKLGVHSRPELFQMIGRK